MPALLLAQAFFAGTEMSLVASDRKALRRLARKGDRGGGIALDFISNPEKFLSLTIFGGNLAVIGITILMTSFLLKTLGSRGLWVVSLALPPVLLFFGDILPKTLVHPRATLWAPRLGLILYFLGKILFPLTFLLSRATRGVLILFGISGLPAQSAISRDEIISLVVLDEKESELQAPKRELIRNMLSASETLVEKIMVPLIRIQSLPEEATLRLAGKRLAETGHSRLPIFCQRVDEMVGVVYALDLFHLGPEEEMLSVRTRMHPVQFVPESARAGDLIARMREERFFLAIVVNEYGGTVGLVTFRDLLREVLGAIGDEKAPGGRKIIPLLENRYRLKGDLDLETFNQAFPQPLPEGDYETLAGFILKTWGRIPRKGERLAYGPYQFLILEGDPHAIRVVELEISPEKAV
jgi:CBS domain containing-hemolysin-like protein